MGIFKNDSPPNSPMSLSPPSSPTADLSQLQNAFRLHVKQTYAYMLNWLTGVSAFGMLYPKESKTYVGLLNELKENFRFVSSDATPIPQCDFLLSRLIHVSGDLCKGTISEHSFLRYLDALREQDLPKRANMMKEMRQLNQKSRFSPHSGLAPQAPPFPGI